MISMMSMQDLAGLRCDSRPFQVQKKLRRSLVFHFFQNVNFFDKPHGKFGTDLFNGNLSRVPRRHRKRGLAHLLADHSGIDTSKYQRRLRPRLKAC